MFVTSESCAPTQSGLLVLFSMVGASHRREYFAHVLINLNGECENCLPPLKMHHPQLSVLKVRRCRAKHRDVWGKLPAYFFAIGSSGSRSPDTLSPLENRHFLARFQPSRRDADMPPPAGNIIIHSVTHHSLKPASCGR